MHKKKIPIVCIVGSSKSGKTLLIEKLIPELKNRGFSVGTIKHDPHDHFEMDKPGKDTWRHRMAGASATIISSPKRVALIMDVEYDHSPDELLRFFEVDVVLAEGYKSSYHPKIEVVKPGNEIVCKDDDKVIAIVVEGGLETVKTPFNGPIFNIKDIDNIVELILRHLKLI